MSQQQTPYERRVQELEAAGMSTSDAQGVADLEFMRDAAPAMLEAAEALLERLNHLSSNAAKHVFHKQFDDLANVIAKARGEV